MKTLILLSLLAALIYFDHGSSKPTPKAAPDSNTPTQPAANPSVAREIVVVPPPSYTERWKTGPNAYTDLKTGPNAQVTFEPFLPNEQANWNQTPGYTIVAGRATRVR